MCVLLLVAFLSRTTAHLPKKKGGRDVFVMGVILLCYSLGPPTHRATDHKQYNIVMGGQSPPPEHHDLEETNLYKSRTLHVSGCDISTQDSILWADFECYSYFLPLDASQNVKRHTCRATDGGGEASTDQSTGSGAGNGKKFSTNRTVNK